MSRPRRREPVTLEIDSLSHEGRGVGRVDGKTVFVHGALPGEQVVARVTRRHGRYDEAETLEVLRASPRRITPRCAHFGVCGGCSLQHIDEDYQLEHKQAVLLELLAHHGEVEPARLAAPIRGPQWGYRRKARLGAKHVAKKGGVIVGFRERASPYVTDCQACDVLDARVARELPALRALLDGLSIRDRVPQLEVACSDDVAAIVVRHLAPLDENDRDALAAFARRSGIDIHLQSGGLETITPLSAPSTPLCYRVDGLTLHFEPADFTQVNAAINEQMVARALAHLAPGADARVADLFCGIGNFTLPLARRAGQVVGVEGAAALVARARENALGNGLENCEFAVCDLSSAEAVASLALGNPSHLLLDPPRAGAAAVVEGLDFSGIERIVYVSCNPVTFARDAGVLVARHGYRLAETGILDMFPHTAHVESLSLFTRG